MALNYYTEGNPAAQSARPKQKARTTDLGRLQMGNLSIGQLGEGYGTGVDFQVNARQGGIQALKDHFSSQNEEDAAAQGEIRDYYRNALSGLGQMGDRRGTAFDTNMQRGAQNLLGQFRRSQAGTGRTGGRQEADILQRLSEEYTKGINDLSGQQLREAGAIQGGLQGVVDTDMRERAFQNQQAKTLADYYAQQQQLDLGREEQLASQRGGEDNWMAAVLPAVGMGVGAAFGNPMAGAAIGSAAGGAMGGTAQSGQAGMGNAMGLAQLMQQQQMMDQLARSQSGGSNYYGGYSNPNPYSSGYLQNQFNSMRQY